MPKKATPIEGVAGAVGTPAAPTRLPPPPGRLSSPLCMVTNVSNIESVFACSSTLSSSLLFVVVSQAVPAACRAVRRLRTTRNSTTTTTAGKGETSVENEKCCIKAHTSSMLHQGSQSG